MKTSSKVSFVVCVVYGQEEKDLYLGSMMLARSQVVAGGEDGRESEGEKVNHR